MFCAQRQPAAFRVGSYGVETIPLFLEDVLRFANALFDLELIWLCPSIGVGVGTL